MKSSKGAPYPKNSVILSEADHSLTVICAAEGPAVALAIAPSPGDFGLRLRSILPYFDPLRRPGAPSEQ